MLHKGDNKSSSSNDNFGIYITKMLKKTSYLVFVIIYVLFYKCIKFIVCYQNY